jgi:hypothetical protein
MALLALVCTGSGGSWSDTRHIRVGRSLVRPRAHGEYTKSSNRSTADPTHPVRMTAAVAALLPNSNAVLHRRAQHPEQAGRAVRVSGPTSQRTCVRNAAAVPTRPAIGISDGLRRNRTGVPPGRTAIPSLIRRSSVHTQHHVRGNAGLVKWAASPVHTLQNQ